MQSRRRAGFNLTWPPEMVRTVLVLVAADLSVELPRPLPPFARYVGPLLPEPPRPLPPDLEAFVSGAQGLSQPNPTHVIAVNASILFLPLAPLAASTALVCVSQPMWRSSAGANGMLISIASIPTND